MERRGPSHSGPFSLACTSCFKSKCKCVARPDGDGCERCHRLKKQCKQSDSVRRRTIKKKENPTDRIAQLESTLHGLISQLQSRNIIDGDATQQQSRVHSEQPRPASTITSAQPSHTAGNEEEDSDNFDDEDAEYGGSLESAHSSGSPRTLIASEPLEPQVSEAESEILLSRFRSCMLHHFAFVQLSENLTAQELRRDRPFLLRAIICAMSTSMQMRVARAKGLKREICEVMLAEKSEPSASRMDLLLALLTYMSWGWDHASLPWLMAQAKSIAGGVLLDGLDRQDAKMRALFTPGLDPGHQDMGSITRKEFLEQHRAVLGCFVLSSVFSTYCGQGDALRWTPQMETGLAAISTNKDCFTDATLAVQVRVQLLTQKSVQIQQQQQLEQGQATSTEMASVPALLDLARLQGQLQEVEISLAGGASHRNLIMAHICFTQLQISETTYIVNSMVSVMVSQFGRMTAAGSGAPSTATSRHERIQCLWQCVYKAHACISGLLALPLSDFKGISFLQWAQLAHCAVALNRLTNTIEDTVWDRAAARAEVDVPALIARVAEKLELVAQANGEQGHDELFTQLAGKMREFCSDVIDSTAHVTGQVGREAEDDTWRGPAGLMPW